MASQSTLIKQSIKELEIPVNKFNDVAIPHHLDSLRQHRENIKKFQIRKDWNKVQREQIHTSRLLKQLEQFLYEIDTLRAQVDDKDIEKFDELTLKSRNNTINAIRECLESKFEPPSPSLTSPKLFADDDTNNTTLMYTFDEDAIQRQEEQDEIQRQDACIDMWNSLQNEFFQLHELLINFNELIHDQKKKIDTIESEMIESDKNIQSGIKYLTQASKLKSEAYLLFGALIGTCIGGPVGLFTGLKLGGLTAFSCGALGFTGAIVLKKKHLDRLKANDQQAVHTIAETSREAKCMHNNSPIKCDTC